MAAFSYKCPFCNYQNWTEENKSGGMRECSDCKQPSIVPRATKGATVVRGDGKYPSLRVISGYFQLSAWLSIIISIIMAIGTIGVGGHGFLGIISAVILVIAGVTSFLINSAFGELIILAIDIEANTRKAAEK